MPITIADWPSLESVVAGIDGNKPAITGDLAGRTIVVENDDGNQIEHVFDTGTVTYTFRSADGSDPVSSTDAYEAFAVADGLYSIHFHDHAHPNDSVSILVDDDSGRTLTILTDIYPPEEGKTRVRQAFVPGTVGGTVATGSAPAPSPSLVGRRILWVHSDNYAYEHLYLSTRWLTWQCMAGAERGLADTEEATTYQMRPGIFVLGRRRNVSPFAALTVIDARDPQALRSYGALFGLSSSEDPVHATFGAIGLLLSTTSYPPQFGDAVFG